MGLIKAEDDSWKDHQGYPLEDVTISGKTIFVPRDNKFWTADGQTKTAYQLTENDITSPQIRVISRNLIIEQLRLEGDK